jgi:hypothetical protein
MKLALIFLIYTFLSYPPIEAEWKTCNSVTMESVRTDEIYAPLLHECTDLQSKGYMRDNLQKSVGELPPGWEKVQNDSRLREFSYRVDDEAVETGKKEGRVILFDAEPARLAAWIANAVVESSQDQRTYSWERAHKLANLIAGQSGAQFPVVGLVWEDMEGTGHPKAYGFLDGLTVLGSPSSFYEGGSRTTSKVGEEGLKQGLMLRWGKNAKAGLYARIASTERDQVKALYQKKGVPCPSIEGNDYAIYTRTTFIAAMGSTRNELLVAAALDLP